MAYPIGGRNGVGRFTFDALQAHECKGDFILQGSPQMLLQAKRVGGLHAESETENPDVGGIGAGSRRRVAERKKYNN